MKRSAIIGAAFLAAACTVAQPGTKQLLAADPLLIDSSFKPTGWMGDVEAITLDPTWSDNPHSGPSSIKAVYDGGDLGWAGVYWQNEPDNWCKKPGMNLDGLDYTQVTFWARGATGKEIVEFIAGGISDCEAGNGYEDSFKAATKPPAIPLGTEWKKYSLDISSKDQTSVIGGFAWVVAASRNPDGVVFYLDDMQYE